MRFDELDTFEVFRLSPDEARKFGRDPEMCWVKVSEFAPGTFGRAAPLVNRRSSVRPGGRQLFTSTTATLEHVAPDCGVIPQKVEVKDAA